MAQIISLLASIAIAVAIFYVIGEIRRETARSSDRAPSWPPQLPQDDRVEMVTSATTPSNG